MEAAVEEEEEVAEEKKSAVSLKEPEEITPFSPEKLSVHLIVEVGRMRMSVQQIMDLSAGNVLELPVTPEQGVDLVVNGKKIGKGELVKLGDVLGVRIVQI